MCAIQTRQLPTSTTLVLPHELFHPLREVLEGLEKKLDARIQQKHKEMRRTRDPGKTWEEKRALERCATSLNMRNLVRVALLDFLENRKMTDEQLLTELLKTRRGRKK